MDNFSDESLQKGRRTAVLIGCVMISSILVYAGVVEYLVRSKAPFTGFSPLPADVFNKLRLILLGVCLLDFAFIPYLRNQVLSAQNQAGKRQGGKQFAPTDRLVTSSIISFALCESIAIYGLVLFLVNGARQEFYLFFCLSLIAFAIHFPRHERWQEWAQKIRESAGEEYKGNFPGV